MASGVFFGVVVVAVVATLCAEGRVVPAKPQSIMVDPYGNPMLFLRAKRAPVRPYPQRAMMFTGYYRPARRSANGDQATGIFAEGNAVSGGTYLGDKPTYLDKGPEPIDSHEVSSAEAEAAPENDDAFSADPQPEDPVEEHEDAVEQDQPVAEPRPLPYTTEATPAHPEEAVYNTEAAPVTSKPVGSKKGKKRPVVVEEEDEEDSEEDDDEPPVPFVPFRGGKRRQGQIPNLNNFFPMVFSFPGLARSGSPGSPPGAITAIANSYSTGKSGLASSVATAYGGPPNGKKLRRTPAIQE
ncbi:uncharacterized protein LOC105695443 isoform X2 [Orussus abietinus]|uniref:uncharacterized protein LOC105695443 isoform X2 n=1 Tax=Orussus abietinus TaxID=222816 RepID=UPI000C7161C7|nr:uncharacterized protein LOC105695443 isoform X2 [Orussus abietinus]